MRRFATADLPATADVLVVGGGITGASVARDAALRGLSTVLVERDDFASGTSSRSSKLIHGGLRYLQTYQFAMVHESVREREVMMRIAPHLATLRPFLYLIYEGDPEGRALLNLGLTFYDAFARAPRGAGTGCSGAGRFSAGSRTSTRKACAAVACSTTPSPTTPGSCWTSWSRPHRAGALVANHREVTGLVRDGGRVVGAEVTDRAHR